MITGHIGEIRLFCGAAAPKGWLICNGTELRANEFSALYSVIGTHYGGNGNPSFRIPDLRDRTPIGVNHAGTQNNPKLGEVMGAPRKIITAAHLPPHGHGLMATDAAGTVNKPGPEVALARGQKPSGPVPVRPRAMYTTEAANSKLGAETIDVTGAVTPPDLDNHQPSQAVNFIICFEGLHP